MSSFQWYYFFLHFFGIQMVVLCVSGANIKMKKKKNCCLFSLVDEVKSYRGVPSPCLHPCFHLVRTKFTNRCHQAGNILAFCDFCRCSTEVRGGNNLLITIYTTPCMLKMVLDSRKYGFQWTFWYEIEVWKGKRTPCSMGSSREFLFLVFQRIIFF